MELDEYEKKCDFQKSDCEPRRITMQPYDSTIKKWSNAPASVVGQEASENGKSSQQFNSAQAFVGNNELAVSTSIAFTNNDNKRLCPHLEYNDVVIDLWMAW